MLERVEADGDALALASRLIADARCGVRDGEVARAAERQRELGGGLCVPVYQSLWRGVISGTHRLVGCSGY